jgi:hypothetical protein
MWAQRVLGAGAQHANCLMADFGGTGLGCLHGGFKRLAGFFACRLHLGIGVA